MGIDPERIALGTVQWGLDYGIANVTGRPSDDELARLHAEARAHGLNTIDTAAAYGDAEQRVGRLGSSFRIITKLHPDVAADEVFAKVRSSREALGRDSIDTLLLHRAEHRTAFGGSIWRELMRERAAGRIERLGVSAATPEEAHAALNDDDVSVIQVACNLFDQRLVDDGFFRRAHELGREVHVRSVFLQGAAFLTPEALPPALTGLKSAATAIRAAAVELGVPLGALFLHWAAALPVARLVLGFETSAQLSAALAWCMLDVDATSMAALASRVAIHDPQLVDPSKW